MHFGVPPLSTATGFISCGGGGGGGGGGGVEVLLLLLLLAVLVVDPTVVGPEVFDGG